MSIQNNWSGPEKKQFPPLPEDTYEVLIKDIELMQGKAYKSEELVEQLKFTFEVLGGEFKGRLLFKNISPVLSAGGPGKNPANFNLIYEAVYRKTPYQDQLKTIDANVVNGLINKTLRLVVKEKTSEQGNQVNKIDAFMKSKEIKGEVKDQDIPVIEEGESTVNLSDIPF